ncbi:aldo/keto reductase [Salinilacihabitans rarus]|uniref:aldo/keto reductase n=1 Tax=Salinilacihabitans rarus TaxID=2961596 RepID=UPI0020C8D121|nr:aldo/keto reductase [Salinilacihabitans rarus]
MRTNATTGTVVAGGAEVPALGFGTARTTGEECRRAVEAALDAGYRHVDTATMYDNEAAVGEALAESDVPREEVFVVTKVHPDDAAYDDAVESARGSRDRLGLDRIDLLLLHAPSDVAPLAETIEAMNDLQADDVVDHVGVSNFSVAQLDEAVDRSETPIVTNQVRYHPYEHRHDLLSYCVENEVLLTAHTPLAEGAVVGDERLDAIGEPHGKSAPQVALRWLLQQPYVAAIPKAASRAHAEENLDVFDFELSDEEMQAVFEIGGGLPEDLAATLGL